MKRRGFTLIELLVVIAIIAILAAILFPVFAQAKAAAKKISALSNDKQTSLGVLMYNSDSDGVFPRGSGNGWYYPRDGGWSWDTQPYIKSLPILRDPSDPLSTAQWPTWFTGQPVVGISFASNGFMDYRNGGWGMYGIMGMDQSRAAGGWMDVGTANESGVNKSAETVLIAGRFSGNNLFGCGDLIAGVNWWDYTGAGKIPDGTRDGTAYYAPATSGQILVNKNNRYGAVAAVYADNGIFTFADGHAKAMNPIKTDPDPVLQPQNNMWDAARP